MEHVVVFVTDDDANKLNSILLPTLTPMFKNREAQNRG
jgi:hypothetical protein